MGRRMGLGRNSIVGHKSICPFVYDSMITLYKVVHLQLRMEIILPEYKEVGTHPYHSAFKLAGQDMKWARDPGRLGKDSFIF